MNKKLKLLIIIGIIILIFVIAVIIATKIIYKEPKVPVICYHNVAKQEEITPNSEEQKWAITVENFEEQMKFLHNFKFKTLTLDEFYKWKKGEIKVPFNSVLVTFDDGLLSNYEYAFPILKKYNINATVFLIGKNCYKETTEAWNGNIQTYMGLDILKKAKEEYPNVEFASHTYDMHAVGKLKDMNKDDMKKDLEQMSTFYKEGHKAIYANMKKEMNAIKTFEYVAYPFGLYNDELIEILKGKNVKMAFTLADNKKATRGEDDFKVNRINTSTDKPLYKFALRFLLPY